VWSSLLIPNSLHICGRFLLTTVALVPGLDTIDPRKWKLDCVNRCFGAVGRDGGGAVVGADERNGRGTVVGAEDEGAVGGAALVFGGADSVLDTLICGYIAEGEAEALLEDCRRAGSLFSV